MRDEEDVDAGSLMSTPRAQDGDDGRTSDAMAPKADDDDERRRGEIKIRVVEKAHSLLQ